MHLRKMHLPKPVFDTIENAVLLFFSNTFLKQQLNKIPYFCNKQAAFITVSFSWFNRADFFSKLEICIL